MKKLKREKLVGADYECKIMVGGLSKVKFYEGYFKLIFIISGELKVECNDEVIALAEQSYMIVRPSDYAVFLTTNGNVNAMLLDVSKSEIKKILNYFQNDTESYVIAGEEPLVVSGDYNVKLQIDELRGRLIKYGDHTKLISKLISLEIVSGIVRAMHRKKHYDTIPQRIVEVVDGLKNLNNLQIGIKYLENTLNYSRSQLCKIFNKYYGKTPHDYVMELRLSYAYNMIVYTDYDYVTIAESVGIHSISHFYEKFKVQYKINPAELRKGKRLEENE